MRRAAQLPARTPEGLQAKAQLAMLELDGGHRAGLPVVASLLRDLLGKGGLMAKPRHFREPALAPDALDGLRLLASAPHPDAQLFLACDRLMVLWEESLQLYRYKRKGYLDQVRATGPERDSLEAMIATTPARTPAGRRAKAETALSLMPGGGPRDGSIFRLPRSALVDALNGLLGSDADVMSGGA